MAFFDFLKNEDGSWNVRLIVGLLWAALLMFGLGFAASFLRPAKMPTPPPAEQVIRYPTGKLVFSENNPLAQDVAKPMSNLDLTGRQNQWDIYKHRRRVRGRAADVPFMPRTHTKVNRRLSK